MSTQYYAQLVVGCIQSESVIFNIQTKQLKHKHPNPADAKYCKECGVKLVYDEYINEYVIYDTFEILPFQDDLKLVGETVEVVSEANYPSVKRIVSDEIVKTSNEIKNKLVEFGLLDEKTFGTYLVLLGD